MMRVVAQDLLGQGWLMALRLLLETVAGQLVPAEPISIELNHVSLQS